MRSDEKNSFVLIIMVMSLFSIDLNLYAEEFKSTPLTLEMSIQQGFENNWSIKQKEEKIQETEYEKDRVKTDFLPSGTTSYQYTKNGGPLNEYNIYKNNYQWTTQVTQPVFAGFALSSAYDIAKLDIESAKVDLEMEQLDLAMKIKEVFFTILKADKAVEVASKEVESFELHLKAAKDFYEAGAKTINDVLMAEVDLANSKYELVKAETAASTARIKINVLLSKQLNEEVELVDIFDSQSVQIDLEKLISLALNNRPEIEKLNIFNIQNDRQIQNAKSAYYPSINMTYSYSKQGDSWNVARSKFDEGTSWQAVVGLTWKLWNWKNTSKSIQKIRSQKTQLEQNKEATEDQIRSEVKEAVLNLLETEKNIPTAKKAVEQAEENQKFNNERYKEQVATSLDVADAQKYLSRAKLNYYNAIYDHLIAKASLLRAIGAY
jgi:outer membrane protein